MLKTPEIRDRHRFPQSVRACMTAATISASTGPQIRNRTPVVNSTSTTPGDIGNTVIGTASVGTSNVNDANRAAPCNCRRQRNSWLACIPASRATADATAPGSIAAATMRSFSALDHLRRCRTEITVSACVFVIGSSINSSPLMRSSDFAERLSVALHVGPEVPTRSRPYDAASDRARRSPLALEAGGEAFRGLAGRSLAHRAGYAERSAEQLLLRAQRGQPLFVRARNIGTQ